MSGYLLLVCALALAGILFALSNIKAQLKRIANALERRERPLED